MPWRLALGANADGVIVDASNDAWNDAAVGREQMQRTRLAGHDDADIQAAIDEFDAADIRRITAVWATL